VANPETRLALRPREAAEALGISARTLWTWTQQGRVPCKRIGKTVVYSTDALRRWLDGQAEPEGGAL
jgi:excisionase family DNA binding protein